MIIIKVKRLIWNLISKFKTIIQFENLKMNQIELDLFLGAPSRSLDLFNTFLLIESKRIHLIF